MFFQAESEAEVIKAKITELNQELAKYKKQMKENSPDCPKKREILQMLKQKKKLEKELEIALETDIPDTSLTPAPKVTESSESQQQSEDEGATATVCVLFPLAPAVEVIESVSPAYVNSHNFDQNLLV